MISESQHALNSVKFAYFISVQQHIFHNSLHSSSSASWPISASSLIRYQDSLMCRFRIEVPQNSTVYFREHYSMAQERSTSANSRENDSPRSTERHRRSTIHQLSISENDTSSGSSDQSNDNVPAEDETSPKSKRLKSRARSQLSSSSVSGWHDSLEALNSNSEDEDPETPLPSRLSTPTNDSGSETIQTSGNVPQAQQTDKNATQVIDLCTPEPEITPPESIPKSNRVLKLSRSPSFGSRDPIKRERSPSTLLNTPRRRRLFKSWESYNEDIARNYKPSGPKFKACARCQSKSMICDGRERCQRCIQKNATCIYNEKGTEPCLACQKRKSKCDKEFPCNRCVARHEKCIYEHEPPKFEESGSKQVIKAEEKTSDHVPSMGIPPPCPEISQDPKKLKRPASGWMNRYREKTEPVQSATRTKERYPRPPKPLRAKKPLRNARDQRGKQIMSRNFPERDEYGLFETRASRTPTKVEITDASWMRLDRGEILQLGNSAPSLELNFNKFLESGTPDSRQWASLPSPISFGGGLKEKTVSQESVGRSSEILKSTAERKRPSFL